MLPVVGDPDPGNAGRRLAHAAKAAFTVGLEVLSPLGGAADELLDGVLLDFELLLAAGDDNLTP